MVRKKHMSSVPHTLKKQYFPKCLVMDVPYVTADGSSRRLQLTVVASFLKLSQKEHQDNSVSRLVLILGK